MKACPFRYHLLLIFSPLIFFNVTLADQVWVGGMTSDVINQNLFIDGSLGDVLLPAGPRVIQATSTNITVTLANNPTVRGNAGGESQLILEANAGFSITFVLAANDLTFKGSANVAQNTLLIYQYGNVPGESGGTVQWVINGGQTLSFTSDVGTSGGTWLYTEGVPNGVPTTPYMLFSRNQLTDTAPNSNVNIVVGPSSIMGFTQNQILGPNIAVADMFFDPSNAIGATGRTTLSIQPTGGVLVYPVVAAYDPLISQLPTTSSILRNTIGGQTSAYFEIQQTTTNPSEYTNLQVVNGNTELFELLIDPFCTLGAQDDPAFIGSYNGIQYGYVVGANGVVQIGNNSVLDYVGTSTNQCPFPLATSCNGATSACSTAGCEMSCTGTLIKPRNPSAFFVDGSYDPFLTSAQILLGVDSALFFRSGVDKFGIVETPNEPFQFDINPANMTGCAGEIVFDVEGQVVIRGSNIGTLLQSKIELLSRDVFFTGGPLFYNTSQVIFPIRSFTFDSAGLPRQYNKGEFFINNRMILGATTLVHTDLNHTVVSKNDVVSQPAYTGGERPLLCGGTERPKIVFYDSTLLMHESAAFTGVDLFVPNRVADSPQLQEIVGLPNRSYFIFFNNGRVLDNGTGRQMVLGTLPGSLACDGCTIVSNDAHLDVFQDVDFSQALGGAACAASAEPVFTTQDIIQSIAGCAVIDPSLLDQTLELDVAANTTVINDQIEGDISNQFAVQTIYLGDSSNISVGTNAVSSPFTSQTLPELLINGNFFSFETRGGPNGDPASSQVTGKGGIFVDLNGTFAISPFFRANMATMVTRSGNGVVNLPKNQVLYHDGVGLGNWKLNLITDSAVIIGPNEKFSDYTLNWIDTTKDFSLFTPYVVDNVNSSTCPPVVSANISPVPTILGRVDQMQIEGSRLGDEAFIKVGQGGFVRELLFFNGCISGEESVGFVILEDDSRVGIGSAHRNVDSLTGSIKLGINGVTIIGNGHGEVVLNEDIEIDNVCSILMGPDFSTTDTLRFTSEDPRVLTVRKTGVLDLRSFLNGATVEFGGQITIVLEPGAQIVANGGIVRLADRAGMVVQTVERAEDIFATNTASDVTITDPFRVKMIGTGTLQLAENSTFFVESDSFLGVETLYEWTGTQTAEIPVTNFTIQIVSTAQFIIGTAIEQLGGAMQVGNTVNRPGHTVQLTIEPASPDGIFQVKSNGFLGFAVGIANKGTNTPNQWTVDNLFNVQSVTMNLLDGLFAHDLIYDGSSSNASLFAIGQDTPTSPLYTYNYADIITPQEIRLFNGNIHGGGNMILLQQDFTGPINPVVGTVDNQVVAGRMTVGTLAALELLPTTDVATQNVNGTVLFNGIKTFNMRSNLDSRARNKANVSQSIPEYGPALAAARGLFIYGPTNSNSGTIERADVYDVASAVANPIPEDAVLSAISIGAALVGVANPADPVNSATFTLIPQ
jgi:hypothetical protein